MATTTMLDNISTAIEQVVKTLRGDVAPTRKRMPLGAFVTFALTEIEKAAKDEPPVAKRRLTALKRNVDDVIAAIAKLSVEDTESEDIDVEITTAFAPTKADGDTPMDDLTTASDQSSTEVSLTGASSASGDSAFAENLDQVAKALQKLKDELGAPSDEKPRARAKKADGNGDRDRGERGERGAGDRDADGWPLDLASDTFLKGDAATEADPVWGYDPDGVASPKAR
ncbi:MAG TPA: hypothetical protein VF469_29705 [Kofleriaceae bacterium]